MYSTTVLALNTVIYSHREYDIMYEGKSLLELTEGS